MNSVGRHVARSPRRGRTNGPARRQNCRPQVVNRTRSTTTTPSTITVATKTPRIHTRLLSHSVLQSTVSTAASSSTGRQIEAGR